MVPITPPAASTGPETGSLDGATVVVTPGEDGATCGDIGIVVVGAGGIVVVVTGMVVVVVGGTVVVVVGGTVVVVVVSCWQTTTVAVACFEPV